MNILPKKRWHVRTKDNIARVRRDEAEAKEEERKRQEKLLLAESEARINFLRKKSGLAWPHNDVNKTKNPPNESTTLVGCKIDGQEHVNLFADYKSHIKKTNKALEDEKKEEREKYEKQIGYLMYLGQDTNEALKSRSWYEVAPKRAEVGDSTFAEKDLKNKQSQDPLTLINSLIPTLATKNIESTTSKLTSKELSTSINYNTKSKKRKREHQEQHFTKHKKAKKAKKYKKRKREKSRTRCTYSSDEIDFEERQQIKRKKLENLRRERLIREANERVRQEALLAPTNMSENTTIKSIPIPRVVQKYNSQFNPEIAKQNMI
ncbi:leukocyte receptor cluster member 1 homolog [Eurosta solidaginis]|uniref:leukocyte receptor cluster member 1 homolog n=1 Tax=Eurosta solidaginis TaxID=178769 RepID=UPI003530752E